MTIFLIFGANKSCLQFLAKYANFGYWRPPNTFLGKTKFWIFFAVFGSFWQILIIRNPLLNEYLGPNNNLDFLNILFLQFLAIFLSTLIQTLNASLVS